MGQMPIVLEDREIGLLRWQVEGAQAVFSAVCPFEEGYIYRLELEGSQPLSLGVLLPEGKRFTLRKKLHISKCRWAKGDAPDDLRCVVDRRRPGEEKPAPKPPVPEGPTPPLPIAFSQLQPLETAEDADFTRRIFQSCGGRMALWEGETYYAAPFTPGGQLGPSAFFCLLEFAEVQGERWCLLRVDARGMPVRFGKE